MSKANFDLPDDKLELVKKKAGVKTKREAIVIALDEYLRRKKIEELLRMKGKVRFDVTKKGRDEFGK